MVILISTTRIANSAIVTSFEELGDFSTVTDGNNLMDPNSPNIGKGNPPLTECQCKVLMDHLLD